MRTKIQVKKNQAQSFIEGFKKIRKIYHLVIDAEGDVHHVPIPENKSDSVKEMELLGFCFTQTRKLHGVLINLWPENKTDLTLIIEGI